MSGVYPNHGYLDIAIFIVCVPFVKQISSMCKNKFITMTNLVYLSIIDFKAYKTRLRQKNINNPLHRQHVFQIQNECFDLLQSRRKKTVDKIRYNYYHCFFSTEKPGLKYKHRSR